MLVGQHIQKKRKAEGNVTPVDTEPGSPLPPPDNAQHFHQHSFETTERDEGVEVNNTTTNESLQVEVFGSVACAQQPRKDTSKALEVLAKQDGRSDDELSRDELLLLVNNLRREISQLKVDIFLGKNDSPKSVDSSEEPLPTAPPKPPTDEQKVIAQPPPAAELHPALFSVRSGRSVSKMRLGRTASISTRKELSKIPLQSTEDYIVMINSMFSAFHNPRYHDYLGSMTFANHLLELCRRVGGLLEKEKRVLEIQSPVYVLGDIHGNLDDLHFFSDHVWPLGMALTAGHFLFLGDYVDRGSRSLEVLAYLFAQKIQHPDKVFLIRGNHETRAVNGWEAFYKGGSFLAQCKARFGRPKGEQVWEICNKVFDRMPLACIVDNSIFCVHGGIPNPCLDESGQDDRLQRIRDLPCPIDIQPPHPEMDDPANSLAFSLVWADPADSEQEGNLDPKSGFGESARGGGTMVFGTKAVLQFLEEYKLDYILRAHEATASGIAVSKSAKVLTIFSTSKDHGCGGEAKCGCVLVDNRKILAINRSETYTPTSSRRGSHGDSFSALRVSSPGSVASSSFSWNGHGAPPDTSLSPQEQYHKYVAEQSSGQGRRRSNSTTSLDDMMGGDTQSVDGDAE